MVCSSLTASVYSIVVQASSGIEEIAVLTLASTRTMTETSAPDLSAAAGAQRNDLFRTGERNAAMETAGHQVHHRGARAVHPARMQPAEDLNGNEDGPDRWAAWSASTFTRGRRPEAPATNGTATPIGNQTSASTAKVLPSGSWNHALRPPPARTVIPLASCSNWS